MENNSNTVVNRFESLVVIALFIFIIFDLFLVYAFFFIYNDIFFIVGFVFATIVIIVISRLMSIFSPYSITITDKDISLKYLTRRSRVILKNEVTGYTLKTSFTAISPVSFYLKTRLAFIGRFKFTFYVNSKKTFTFLINNKDSDAIRLESLLQGINKLN